MGGRIPTVVKETANRSISEGLSFSEFMELETIKAEYQKRVVSNDN